MARLNPSEQAKVAAVVGGALWRGLRWAVRRREFYEEVFVYARPLILGALAFVLWPAEFAAGFQAGAVAGLAWEAGKTILGKG